MINSVECIIDLPQCFFGFRDYFGSTLIFFAMTSSPLAPRARGLTTVMYDGKPVGTPDAGIPAHPNKGLQSAIVDDLCTEIICSEQIIFIIIILLLLFCFIFWLFFFNYFIIFSSY